MVSPAVPAMALNFTTSILIIWANKFAYNAGFVFATILTVIHFIVTYIGLCIMRSQKMFEPKNISPISVLPIAFAFCGFVVFNNLSLQFNSVGTYQLLKVLTTPIIVLIQFIMYSIRLPRSQLLALVPVCAGVALATVSDLETNWRGSLFGTLGIVSTSLYQIWVKTEQERFNCSSEQLLFYQAPISACILVILVPFIENLEKFFSLDWVTLPAVAWTALSALLAFLVNLSIFLVIGKTSPVSYNVLGHAKLVVILVSGYTIFSEPYGVQNVIGVTSAVIGIVWYTHLKLKPVVVVIDKPAQETPLE
jgi:solute carrier family 35 protein E3